MEDNPFSAVVQAIRNDSKGLIPTFYRMGTVKTTSPLTVEVAGSTQDTDDLLKNDMLTRFEIGDQVLMMPIEDEQRYIILCKVVSV